MDLLGHYFGLYLTAKSQNVLEIARFVRFRQRRCGFKKISLKNKKFSQSYDLLHLIISKVQKSMILVNKKKALLIDFKKSGSQRKNNIF